MKIGSKAFNMMLRKLFWTNNSVFLFLLTLKFMISGSVLGSENNLINIVLLINLVIFSIFEFLAIFHIEKGKPNWAIVYPQLKRK